MRVVICTHLCVGHFHRRVGHRHHGTSHVRHVEEAVAVLHAAFHLQVGGEHSARHEAHVFAHGPLVAHLVLYVFPEEAAVAGGVGVEVRYVCVEHFGVEPAALRIHEYGAYHRRDPFSRSHVGELLGANYQAEILQAGAERQLTRYALPCRIAYLTGLFVVEVLIARGYLLRTGNALYAVQILLISDGFAVDAADIHLRRVEKNAARTGQVAEKKSQERNADNDGQYGTAFRSESVKCSHLY